MLATFESARLSVWGLGLILFWLAWSRTVNGWHWQLVGTRIGRWTVPEPREKYPPPRSTEGNPTTFFGALLGLIPILAFTEAIAQRHVAWLGISPFGPLFSIMSVWLLIAVIVFLLWKLAFKPAKKMRISAGWVALSHAIVWIQHVGV